MPIRPTLAPHLFLPLILLLTAPTPAPAQDLTADLLKGIDSITAPGTPGAVAALSDSADVLIVGKGDDKTLLPVAAAGQWGKGRVVILGHTSYLDSKTLEHPGTGAFLANAVEWAAANRADPAHSPRIALVGCDPADFLRARGWTYVRPETGKFEGDLSNFDLLMIADSKLTAAQERAIADFVTSGRGLIAAQTGWGWRQLNGEKPLSENRLNILLAPAGLAFTDGTPDKTTKDGYSVGKPIPPLVHAGRALTALLDEKAAAALPDPDRAQAAAAAIQAVRILSSNDKTWRPRIAAALKAHAADLAPTAAKPLKSANALPRFLLACQIEQLRDLPADKVTAHPAAADFPGPVPADSVRLTRTVEIDTTIPGWHSLGLYAPAGITVTVKLSPGAAKAGLHLRIGCHTDHLWHHGEWKRVPEIALREPAAAAVTTVASPFGGLFYIEVPDGCKAGTVQAEVGGCVESPLFVLGKTNPLQWRDHARAAPGPWAELATSRVILSVPSSAIRDLDDPTEVLALWDKVLDAAADLATIPHERPRPQRYVADVQISAGYMHSGYPIMTHLDAADEMTQAAKLAKGSWGLFHELGHNHQDSMWTFDGTTEVTCNLFSLYICETVCNLPVSEGHGAVKKKDRAERTAKHLATGAKFDKWKSDPFLALEMYIQLREAFGWETYKKVFAEYRGLKKDERPKGNEAERDQWMVRFSRAAGKNLGPFFEAWGVPTSQGARDSIKELPAWMPEGFPPAGEKK